MKKVVLIPSYEPNNNLIKLVDELKKEKVDIIVVNDGSNVKYDNIFKKIEKDVVYLRYKDNHGKGYALKYGFKYIKDNYNDCNIITVDSDGQHKVKDVIKILKMVKNNNTIYLGRRLRDEKVPLKSRIGNSFSRLFFRLSTGKDIYDTQTGLRAFNNALLDFLLNVDGNRFEYEMNVLFEAINSNIELVEETIDTVYEDNNKGTHFKVVRDSLLIYKKVIKYLLSSISSFVIDYGIYVLCNVIGLKLIICNVTARIISSLYNYLVNKNIVFKDNSSIKYSIFKYYLLAFLVLVINSSLLYLFVIIFGFNRYIIKVVIEVALFFFSYFVQNKKIFKKRK